MSEKVKNVIVVAVSVIALGVIAFGFSAEPASAPTAEDRVATLSASIRCPFCSGESLADSQASVAADYRALIADRVEAGATDTEIIEEFAANFGDSFILDTSTSVWSFALWVVPIAALVLGGAVLVLMKRSASRREAT